MEFKTFEEALQEEFMQQRPGTLDDDMENAFDSWISNRDIQELIDIADKYGTFRSQR